MSYYYKGYFRQEDKMAKKSKFSFSAITFLFCFFLSVGVVTAGNAVPFSGIVKNNTEKNKVGIKDPDTKKKVHCYCE
jgi:hypothetical protein